MIRLLSFFLMLGVGKLFADPQFIGNPRLIEYYEGVILDALRRAEITIVPYGFSDAPVPKKIIIASNPDEAISLYSTQFFSLKPIQITGLKEILDQSCGSPHGVYGFYETDFIFLCYYHPKDEYDYQSQEYYRQMKRALIHKVVTHEVFHHYQIAAISTQSDADDNDLLPPEPNWLLEGSAEWFEFRFGDLNREEHRPFNRSVYALRLIGQSTLSDFESYDAGWQEDTYTLGAIATDMLIEAHGISSIGDFYQALGMNDDWKTAFQKAFDQSVEDFYVMFEQERSTLQSTR